jgi:CheY-like chemotaxis protein
VSSAAAPTLHLVLVEDNPGDVELVRLAVQGCCRAALTVLNDGQSAIDYARNGNAADRVLFVVDLNLPRRTGFEVLQAIRGCAGSRRVTAIVLTSSARPSDRNRALALGATHYLSKPRTSAEVDALGSKICAMIQRLAVP